MSSGRILRSLLISLTLLASIHRVIPAFAQTPAAPSPKAPTLDEGLGQFENIVQEVTNLLLPFEYDPKGRRDPFRPYTEVRQSSDDGTEQAPQLPLQRFDLEQLRLIGIIWDVEDPRAMFLDPNSEVYVVGKDERIGRRNGYIATIREGEVVVVETQRVRGEVVYTSRVVRLTR